MLEESHNTITVPSMLSSGYWLTYTGGGELSHPLHNINLIIFTKHVKPRLHIQAGSDETALECALIAFTRRASSQLILCKRLKPA